MSGMCVFNKESQGVFEKVKVMSFSCKDRLSATAQALMDNSRTLDYRHAQFTSI